MRSCSKNTRLPWRASSKVGPSAESERKSQLYFLASYPIQKQVPSPKLLVVTLFLAFLIVLDVVEIREYLEDGLGKAEHNTHGTKYEHAPECQPGCRVPVILP